MKKKFFRILLCITVIMMLCVFHISVGAEEIGAETSEFIEAEIDTVDETDVETHEIESETMLTEAESESVYHTLFTRIWEFVTTYSGETLSVIGSALLLILNLALKHSTSKVSKETKKTLAGIREEVKETLGGQNSVVAVTNKMIDGYNGLSACYDAMKESYDQYGALEGERNRVVGAVFATNAAILEILTTVYVNSKNLPQGVKDLVNLKYANCLKTLEDDKQLIAIVEAVRNNLGNAEESVEPDAEDAEV